MPKNRADAAKAAGKLIKEIDRERMEQVELGIFSEKQMGHKITLAHDLLKAQTATAMISVLGKRSVRQYLGGLSIETHPATSTAASVLQKAIETESKYSGFGQQRSYELLF